MVLNANGNFHIIFEQKSFWFLCANIENCLSSLKQFKTAFIIVLLSSKSNLQLNPIFQWPNSRFESRVARYSLTQYTKTVKNIPNYHNITKGTKIYLMAVKNSK
jgi:hypothetical protein